MTTMSESSSIVDLKPGTEGDWEGAYQLLSQLVSDDPGTQSETIAALEESQDPDLWRLLLEVLAQHSWHGDTTPVTRATGDDFRRLEFSIRGLFCNLSETPANRAKVAVLSESLEHDNLAISYHAALLLGRRGDQAALSHLLEMLNSADEVWAIPAANVLGEMGFSQAADALVAAIASNLPGLHRAAVQALQEMGQPAVPALIGALQHPDDHVRWHAARALGRIGDPEAIPALVQALGDVDSGVRWLAGEALIGLGDDVLEPLLEMLAHTRLNAFIRDSAIHVLSHFQREGLQEITPIVEALKSVDYAMLAPMAAYQVLQELRTITSST
jgi:HEAT repeat protein